MRPLLAIDGDSLAHRAYHALPKSIRRATDKGPANMIVGFTNMVVRLWEMEQPRASVGYRPHRKRPRRTPRGGVPPA